MLYVIHCSHTIFRINKEISKTFDYDFPNRNDKEKKLFQEINGKTFE